MTEFPADYLKILINNGFVFNLEEPYYNSLTSKALWYTVSNTKNAEVIQLLVDEGCDINYTIETGKTVLEQAVEKDIVPVIKILLENHAEFTVDSTCYDILSTVKSTEALNLLIQYGAKVPLIYKGNRTLLMHARNSDLIKKYLELGIDPNIIDENGNTALTYLNENHGMYDENWLYSDEYNKCKAMLEGVK